MQAGLAGNRDRAGLGRVFVLPVATASSRKPPAVVFKKSDQLSDFHALLASVPVRVTPGMSRALQRVGSMPLFGSLHGL